MNKRQQISKARLELSDKKVINKSRKIYDKKFKAQGVLIGDKKVMKFRDKKGMNEQVFISNKKR